jgi:DNA-binding NtrC family response regulator
MRVAQQGESTAPRQAGTVMVVDAEAGQARQILTALSQAGHQCQVFTGGEAALDALGRDGADAMVIDVGIPGLGALELIRRVRRLSPQTVALILVSSPAVASAVAAIREGAFGYLIKPVNPDELALMVAKALEVGALKRENRLLQDQLAVAGMAAAFVAESRQGRHLLEVIRRAAPAHPPVLIEGESGTGKELVARMLHHWSPRARGAFVRVSFKSFSSDAARELLGQAAQPGASALLGEYANRARGGTLFLDEVGEAGAEAQASMLGLLGGEGVRVLAAADRRSDIRVVATTNHALALETAAGRFRADLYFALNVIAIRVAPLRERRADILPLARHFLAFHAAESGRSLTLSPEAEAALLSYPWPGNVRELENAIERAVVMTGADRIPPEALGLGPEVIVPQPAEAPVAARTERPESSRQAARAPEPERPPARTEPSAEPSKETQASPGEFTEGTLAECLDRAAMARVKVALEAAKGDREAASAALGIDRATLTRLIRRLGL